MIDVIAEIGVNHNGDVRLAKEMILAAIQSGANAVKFQTFSADRLVTKGTPKVAYQESKTESRESHYEMIKRLELSPKGLRELFEFCNDNHCRFISTPYDVESVDLLEQIGIEQYKIASADIVDLPLLERIAQTGKPALLSVGMATISEIEQACACLGENLCHERITLLHCVSNYPCSDDSLNLRVLNTLRNIFGSPIGYSDHSIGFEAALVAVGFGVTVIEKHFTTDKNLQGPDHAASSTPEEFRALVNAVRRAESMLGSPQKRCQPEELQMARVSRKSVTLCVKKNPGEEIHRTDLTMMRPGTGIMARHIEEVVGKKARTTLAKHHQLQWTDLE